MNVSTGWWLVLGLTVWWVVCMGIQGAPLHDPALQERRHRTRSVEMDQSAGRPPHLLDVLAADVGADGRRLARPFHSEALCTRRRFCRIPLIRAGGCTWNGK